MKRFPAFIFIISLFCLLFGEVVIPKKIVVPKKTLTEAESGNKKDISSSNESDLDIARNQQLTEDTVYCLFTNTIGLWQIPRKEVAESEAFRLPFVVRLSNKNREGHYCSIEILGKGLKPINHGLTMTISKLLPDSISGASYMIQSLSSAHRIELIPDHTGKHVIQERLYDVNDNLLGYIAHDYYHDGYTRRTERYFGPDGLPRKIAGDASSVYGIQLNTIYDKTGRDSILYLSENGTLVPNRDGAYYLQYTYTKDNKGKDVLIIKSLKEDFKAMIDAYGNCGMYKIVDRFMSDSITTYIDTLGNPMTIPEASYDKTRVGVATVKYSMDQNRNLLDSIIFLGLDGKPVENILGTHKIIIEYDPDYHYEILRRGEGINGNSAPIYENGVAEYTFKCDTLGNTLEYHQYDINGDPVSNHGDLSSYENTFDSISKRQISSKNYTYNPETGKEEVSYLFKRTPEFEYTQYSDGTSEESRYDSCGRQTSTRYYDKDRKLHDNTLYAVDSTQYISVDGKRGRINREFRADGSLRSVYEYDSLKNTDLCKKYDESGFMTDIYLLRYNDDGTFIGQTDCNGFGVPCRSGGTSMRFLHVNVGTILDGSYNTLTVLDEFGEPDYLVSTDGIYSSRGFDEPRYGNYVFRDEYGNEILKEQFKELRDSLPKIMTIEVIDSCAYALGIRDNDVILSYGNYRVDLNKPLTEIGFKIDWTVRNVVEAAEPRDMVVFRVEDGPARKYGLDTIRVPAGSPSQIGFTTHIRYLTQRQKERILGCTGVESGTMPQEEMTNYVIIAYPNMFRGNRTSRYATGIIDPAVLSGVCDASHSLKWDYRDGEDYGNVEDVLSSDIPYPTEKHFFFTKNGNSSIDMPFVDRTDDGVYLVGGYIDNNLHEKLLGVYSRTAGHIDSLFAATSKIKPKMLCGYWTVEPQDANGHNADGYVYFEKDGTYYGQFDGLMYVPEDEIREDMGSPLFSMRRKLEGRWREADNIISFKPAEEDNMTGFRCIDILNPTGDAQEAIDYFNDDFIKYPNYYMNRMSPLIDIDKYAFVKHIDKRSLVLEDGNGNEIRFNKQKGKPAQNRAKPYPLDSIRGNWMMTDGHETMLLSLNKYGVVNIYMTLTGRPESVGENETFNLKVEALGRWDADDRNITVVIDTSSIQSEMLNIVHSDLEDKYFKVVGVDKDQLCNVLSPQMLTALYEPLSIKVLGDRTISFDGDKLHRMPYRISFVRGTIEDEDGYLAQSGLTGEYIVLRWCDWNCTMGADAFASEAEKCMDQPKTIALLPFHFDDDDNTIFGDPMVMECPSQPLGIRLRDQEISYPYFFREILSRYLIVNE